VPVAMVMAVFVLRRGLRMVMGQAQLRRDADWMIIRRRRLAEPCD